MGVEPPKTTDPAALGKLRFAAEGKFDAGAVVVEPFTLTLDDTHFSGHFRRAAGEDPVGEFALRGDTFDIARYIPPPDPASEPFALPSGPRRAARRVVYFPGSTIGNFSEPAAVALLAGVARTVGPGGGLLVGADLRKDPRVLERAYDDARGVTAAFNLNLLARMNRELEADFDLRRFRHRAVWAEAASRIEMHLVSEVDQAVHVGGVRIDFARGESICTEHSHKYTVEGFQALAARAGFKPGAAWVDANRWFAALWLEA